jgi:multidrug transporter EmrE-like cation transporter
MRWQVLNAGPVPNDNPGKFLFIFNLFLNPWIIFGVIATLFAGISWMLAMTKFDISYAYPWIGLNFILMLFFGVILFDESINYPKLIGTFLVIAGLITISRG